MKARLMWQGDWPVPAQATLRESLTNVAILLCAADRIGVQPSEARCPEGWRRGVKARVHHPRVNKWLGSLAILAKCFQAPTVFSDEWL
jgi:hypothetical protein